MPLPTYLASVSQLPTTVTLGTNPVKYLINPKTNNITAAWNRAKKLAQMTGLPLATCRTYLKTAPGRTLRLIDTSDMRNPAVRKIAKDLQAYMPPTPPAHDYTSPEGHQISISSKETPETRPSLGDPTRPPRALAPMPNLSIDVDSIPITKQALLELKELCNKHFHGEYLLLAHYAKNIGQILHELELGRNTITSTPQN